MTINPDKHVYDQTEGKEQLLWREPEDSGEDVWQVASVIWTHPEFESMTLKVHKRGTSGWTDLGPIGWVLV